MSRADTIRLIRQLRRLRVARRPRRVLPRMLQPDAIRLEYFKGVRRILDSARDLVTRELVPQLASILAESKRDGVRMDAGGKRVNATMDRITKMFWDRTFHPRDAEALAHAAANRTSDFAREQFNRQTRAGLGVDVFAHEPSIAGRVEDFVAENVALIKTVPNQYFDDIEKAVTRAVSSGTRHEDLAKELTERYGVAENRAKLIARDQVGKLYGQINEARQDALGVTKYVWRTARDNRVRDEHAILDGQTFEWAEPPEDGHPGEAINCRCYAEPDFSDVLDGTEADAPAPPKPEPVREPVFVAPPPEPEYVPPPVPAYVPPPPPVPQPAPPAKRALGVIPDPSVSRAGADLVAGKKLSADDQRLLRQRFDILAEQYSLTPEVAPLGSVLSLEKMRAGWLGYRDWTGKIGVAEHAREALGRGLEKVGQGLRHANPDEVGAIHTIMHETVHGTSNMDQAAYRGAGAKVEEVTTELTARAMTRALFSEADHEASKVGLHSAAGSYQKEITDVAVAVGNVTKEMIGPAMQRVERASFEMRKGSSKSKTSDEHVQRFVDHLGLDEEQRAKVYILLTRSVP